MMQAKKEIGSKLGVEVQKNDNYWAGFNGHEFISWGNSRIIIGFKCEDAGPSYVIFADKAIKSPEDFENAIINNQHLKVICQAVHKNG